MVFEGDLHRFVGALREYLGPQLQNIPLLYQGAPELRDILSLFNINLETSQEPLNTKELRARFQTLVEHVFRAIAETRLLALFLDDLHDADESSVHYLLFELAADNIGEQNPGPSCSSGSPALSNGMVVNSFDHFQACSLLVGHLHNTSIGSNVRGR